jgi:hypothetical protein
MGKQKIKCRRGRRDFSFLFILILIYSGGCVVRQPAAIKKEIPQTQIRGAFIPQNYWIHSSPETMKNRISFILDDLRKANFNLALFETGGSEKGVTVYTSRNLDLAQRLGALCQSYGAEILQVREKDITISLIDKREIIRNSGADILISIHANAAGTSRGYLGVGGTSTYYHYPFWAGFSEKMYYGIIDFLRFMKK